MKLRFRTRNKAIFVVGRVISPADVFTLTELTKALATGYVSIIRAKINGEGVV